MNSSGTHRLTYDIICVQGQVKRLSKGGREENFGLHALTPGTKHKPHATSLARRTVNSGGRSQVGTTNSVRKGQDPEAVCEI